MKVYKKLFIILYCSLFSLVCFAQDKDIRVANEYYLSSEYNKAYVKFEELSRKTQNIPFIYGNYLSTLKNLDKKEEAEKFIKRAVKAYPQNLYYKLDLYLQLKDNKDSKFDKYFDGLVQDIKKNQQEVEIGSEYLLKNNDLEGTLYLLNEGRKASGNKSAYAISLSKVYLLLGRKAEMISEILNYLNENPFQMESIKNNLQNSLKEKQDFNLLEDNLYERIQKEPDNITYNELLLWINIQNKNFRGALLQAKAIDRRGNLQGSKLIEVGKIALENKDFEAATRFFQSVIDNNSRGYNYSIARRLLIYSKEESVKNSFPIDKQKIRSLITDYQTLISELGKQPTSYEAMRNMAVLYGFYLDQKDTAVIYLQKVINEARTDDKLRALAKINLGDIYLLNQEPWEASLLYSQVEKDMKEELLGHESKLRNAKLAYYKGEFELAQAHLDILKMATTREIANDAMELSILIQDNSALDTSYEALSEYAAIDLLLFQNKDEEALASLDDMLVKYPEHSLTDEIYWLQSKIYRKRKLFDEAVEKLDKILELSAKGIFADDAAFTKAQIIEEQQKDSERAMELYKSFLFDYPGSIYTAEARKRFRMLRGDKL